VPIKSSIGTDDLSTGYGPPPSNRAGFLFLYNARAMNSVTLLRALADEPNIKGEKLTGRFLNRWGLRMWPTVIASGHVGVRLPFKKPCGAGGQGAKKLCHKAVGL